MEINFLVLLVGGVASLVLGMIWYGKALFGDAYMKALGADTNMSPEKMKKIQEKMWQLFLTQFILAVFQVWVLAVYINSSMAVITPVSNALWIWAGFVMPTLAGGAMWSARPRKDAWKIFFITSGYNLVLFIIFAVIIKAWM